VSLCCYPFSEALSKAVLGKILKDISSFDMDMDKLLKSVIPGWELLGTCWEARGGDGPDPVLERGELIPSGPRRKVNRSERTASQTLYLASPHMYQTAAESGGYRSQRHIEDCGPLVCR